jgi:hypothetical protein
MLKNIWPTNKLFIYEFLIIKQMYKYSSLLTSDFMYNVVSEQYLLISESAFKIRFLTYD